eukprot:scaffold20981_cov66-Skeletonema_marinoi.AAC.1
MSVSCCKRSDRMEHRAKQLKKDGKWFTYFKTQPVQLPTGNSKLKASLEHYATKATAVRKKNELPI